MRPIARQVARLTLALVALCTVAAGARGQTLSGKAVEPSQAKEWSERAAKLALAEARAWDIRLEQEDGPRARLTEQPVLKWENPYEASVYGSSFVWLHDGRPAAIACIYKFFTTKKEFSVEFHSLAEGPLVALKGEHLLWQPTKAGVEFKPLAGLASPAKSASARLTQMRSIARDFTADVTIWSGTNHNLRLLTQPLLRYGKGSDELIDGAIFAYSRATDPDVLLVLEARVETGKEPRWEYALARMHGGNLKVRYRDDEVWSVDPLAPPYYQKNGPYTTFQNIPEPNVD